MQTSYIGPVSGIAPEQRKKIERFINKSRYAAFATTGDGKGVRLAYMTNHGRQTLDDLFFVSTAEGEKMDQLRQNPECEIMFARRRGQVMIHGQAVILEADEMEQDDLMIELMEYFPMEVPAQKLSFIRIVPTEVRAMIL